MRYSLISQKSLYPRYRCDRSREWVVGVSEVEECRVVEVSGSIIAISCCFVMLSVATHPLKWRLQSKMSDKWNVTLLVLSAVQCDNSAELSVHMLTAGITIADFQKPDCPLASQCKSVNVRPA